MKRTLIAAALATCAIAAPAFAGATLDSVKQKGSFTCGVNAGGVAGFSLVDSKGEWTGIDADYCKAVSAALFGATDKIKYVGLTAQQRFTALQSGEVDILARNTTGTLARDTGTGLRFIGANFYDGQGFMVPAKLGVKSAKDLNGATVCVQPGTTTELNLADYFRSTNMQFKPVVIEKLEEVISAFFSGRCDVYTTDASGLASTRATNAPNPNDYVILPELVSKEPLGPMVRKGDEQWFDVTRWVLMAMIEAEEYGVTSKNVDEMLKSTNPVIQRLLGVSGEMGKNLGLDNKWAYNIIKLVGNYGESYERNLGASTKLNIPRGLNKLWTQGGLMYALPVR
jgi:general L-amino acid transport system substrate-binding protein